MSMEKVWLNGNFYDTPLPKLLYRIWNSKRTGRLKIKKENISKNIDFFEGNAIISRSCIDHKNLLSYLQKEKLISPSHIRKCEQFAESNKVSLLKAMTALNTIPSLKLWGYLELFFMNDISLTFDWVKAEFFFDSTQEINKSDIMTSVSTLRIIRKGIYDMENQDLINSHIPSSDEYIYTYPNKSFLYDDLNSNELYLLNNIGDKIKIGELYQLVEIGKNETNRLIFLFKCLRIAGPHHKTLNHITQELSKVELHNILESFNKKCTSIFKYISKEIGPVALSVLEKCIEDTKSNLPPQLQNIKIFQDGKIDISSTPSTNPNLPGEIKLEEFLDALNEILVSELLTIKKTLGDEHESKVSKSLKNIGKWNLKKIKS